MGLFRLVICCQYAVSLYFISQSLGFYTCGCEAMAPISGYNNHRHLFTTTLAISKKKDGTTGTNANSVPYAQKRQEFMRSIRQKIDELVTGTLVRTKVCTRSLQHALYWMTALDAITSVIRNEYSDIFGVGASQNQGVVQGVYSMLFYFARMRPRLLYSIGALVRALSLCTPLQYLIDPSVGVGAGIHLFAYLTGSRVRTQTITAMVMYPMLKLVKLTTVSFPVCYTKT